VVKEIRREFRQGADDGADTDVFQEWSNGDGFASLFLIVAERSDAIRKCPVFYFTRCRLPYLIGADRTGAAEEAARARTAREV
jgi:hypothetical protein